MRHDLSVLQKSDHLYRRNEILDELGQRTKHGGDRRSNRHDDGLKANTVHGEPTVLTTKDIASDMGVSSRTAERYTNIGKNLKPKASEIVESCPKLANSTGKLQQLAAVVDEDDQAEQARDILQCTATVLQPGRISALKAEHGDAPASARVRF